MIYASRVYAAFCHSLPQYRCITQLALVPCFLCYCPLRDKRDKTSNVKQREKKKGPRETKKRRQKKEAPVTNKMRLCSFRSRDTTAGQPPFYLGGGKSMKGPFKKSPLFFSAPSHGTAAFFRLSVYLPRLSLATEALDCDCSLFSRTGRSERSSGERMRFQKWAFLSKHGKMRLTERRAR